MALPYSRQQLIQRIRKHVNDGFINDDFSISDREITLYINDAIAFGLVGNMYAGAKVTGALEVPEGYLVTYLLPAVSKDRVSGNWKSTLPQPPLSLPLGHSITRVYFDVGDGSISYDCYPIKTKRTPYRIYMPMQPGIRYWAENSTLWLAAADGTSLYGYPLYVQMPSARSSDMTSPLNLPDDAVNAVFDMVVNKIKQRQSMPRDIISDDLPAGANNVNAQR